jgi:hypothetical protein
VFVDVKGEPRLPLSGSTPRPKKTFAIGEAVVFVRVTSVLRVCPALSILFIICTDTPLKLDVEVQVTEWVVPDVIAFELVPGIVSALLLFALKDEPPTLSDHSS